MSAAKNKAIVRRFFEEAWNQGRLDVLDEIVAPDSVNHDPASPDFGTGPQAARQTVTLYRQAFPDSRMTIEDQIAEGDRVVTRWTATGTHQAEFQGTPPSGRTVSVPGTTVSRVERGRIVESWVAWDTLGLLQRIGAIPERAVAGR